MDQVAAMYVVDYDGYTAWMDTGITNEKATFVQSNGIAGLVDALQSTITELSKTPYNDVVITDYMSKWVNIDLDTLKIVDVTTGKTIWSAAEGWLIDEALRPTAQEIPVIAELVNSADYAAGGVDVALFQRRYLKPIMLAFLIAFFNQVSGINAINYYAPRIFQMISEREANLPPLQER